MYARCGSLDDACRVFQHIQQPDAFSWNILVQAHATSARLHDAAAIFFSVMPARDVVSWTTMVRMYAQDRQQRLAQEIFLAMPCHNLVSWNTLLAGYAQQGHIEVAQRVFDAAPCKDEISWTTMLQCYADAEELENALGVFHRLPEHCVFSKTVVMSAVIGCYAVLGDVAEAKRVFERLPEDAVSTFGRMSHCNTCSWNCMVAAFAHKGRLEDAKILFNNTPQHNLASWNNIIGAYAAKGHGHEALDLFQEMVLAGFTPDCITFMHVLGACSHVGMLRRSCELFAWMSSEHYRSPTRQHYYRMIDIVARAGEVAEAERLVHGLPFSPDPVAWSTVLAACRTHGDVECGARAAQQLGCMGVASCSNHYVLLSNMFVAVGRREDAACLRRSMQDKGLRKPPGVSIVEPHF
ncbi:hypothetical protein SELMODRAFT_119347 [Selaginella moellendorffii]|uniref:Pentacotripeptide-repeat region of PRORP domain-containing protein n=1 Tax=Selaginella moellendorffii TaxID=88036 RepID=D8SL71_SELML|nr:hypothetical protein SELMODRAFT_119347 [Selaginella moellendorffii]